MPPHTFLPGARRLPSANKVWHGKVVSGVWVLPTCTSRQRKWLDKIPEDAMLCVIVTHGPRAPCFFGSPGILIYPSTKTTEYLWEGKPNDVSIPCYRHKPRPTEVLSGQHFLWRPKGPVSMSSTNMLKRFRWLHIFVEKYHLISSTHGKQKSMLKTLSSEIFFLDRAPRMFCLHTKFEHIWCHEISDFMILFFEFTFHEGVGTPRS